MGICIHAVPKGSYLLAQKQQAITLVPIPAQSWHRMLSKSVAVRARFLDLARDFLLMLRLAKLRPAKMPSGDGEPGRFRGKDMVLLCPAEGGSFTLRFAGFCGTRILLEVIWFGFAAPILMLLIGLVVRCEVWTEFMDS